MDHALQFPSCGMGSGLAGRGTLTLTGKSLWSGRRSGREAKGQGGHRAVWSEVSPPQNQLDGGGKPQLVKQCKPLLKARQLLCRSCSIVSQHYEVSIQFPAPDNDQSVCASGCLAAFFWLPKSRSAVRRSPPGRYPRGTAAIGVVAPFQAGSVRAQVEYTRTLNSTNG